MTATRSFMIGLISFTVTAAAIVGYTCIATVA
jgi:hypothetical protein